MGKKLRAVLLVVVLLSGVVGRPSAARAVSAFAGALEPTQIANLVQLIEHTTHFIQMVQKARQQVQFWSQNLQGFDANTFATSVRLVRTVAPLIAQFRGICFAADSNIETFKKTHPGRAAPPGNDYKKAYQDLDRDTVDATTRALNAMNVQLTDKHGGLQAEQKVVEDLSTQIESTNGTVKALAITNRLLVSLNHKADKLLVTLTAHAQQMGTHVANEVQRRSYQEKAHQKLMEYRAPTATPVDWSKEGLRGI